MPDAATSASTAPDVVLLDTLCRELAETADAVGEAARHASGLALGARLPSAALARGGRRRLAWRTLMRTLTDPGGLGWAPRGRGVAGAGRLAGLLAGRENLAVSVAVCGLRVRIGAASAGRPELLLDPAAAAVLTAADAGRQAEAVRLFRAIVRDRGAGYAYALLGPAFADVLAWNALTDANPFNDHAGWQVATGRAVTADPLLGLGAAFRALCDRDRSGGHEEEGAGGGAGTCSGRGPAGGPVGGEVGGQAAAGRPAYRPAPPRRAARTRGSRSPPPPARRRGRRGRSPTGPGPPPACGPTPTRCVRTPGGCTAPSPRPWRCGRGCGPRRCATRSPPSPTGAPPRRTASPSPPPSSTRTARRADDAALTTPR
ncbi:hypothetical protein [Streptomyces sp. H27-S2]|uniref:hypothetical protein n=1 Tax=Streptomyces antarcticus TaxID=2996458 RepID=UPI00226F1E21|nr:hypothetical protein [Streptomyces sp. H27-S2]MCY0949522.1 hypothetical protein [Streptomyces sp. H27-S2]